jgi:hypothetical protein
MRILNRKWLRDNVDMYTGAVVPAYAKDLLTILNVLEKVRETASHIEHLDLIDRLLEEEDNDREKG